jgi:hypothetical protein
MSRCVCNLVMLGASVFGSFLTAAEPVSPAGTKSATKADELTEPKVRIVGGSRTTLAEAPFFSFSCEAINPNKSPVMFVGYRPDSFDPPIEKGRISPIYVVELRRNEKWEKHPMGWCGTGVDGIELPTVSAQSFGFAVPADPTIKGVRVGIRWSRPIAFDTAEPDAFKVAWSEPFSLEKLDKNGKP